MIKPYRIQMYDAQCALRTPLKDKDKGQVVHHLPLDRDITPHPHGSPVSPRQPEPRIPTAAPYPHGSLT